MFRVDALYIGFLIALMFIAVHLWHHKICSMKRGIIITICCLISSVHLFQSCKKDKDENEGEEEHRIFELFDVYFIGFEFDNENPMSYYYKNETAYPLRGESDTRVIPSDIVVTSGDVYIVGSENEDDSFLYNPIRALLWKNGELQKLTTPETTQEEATAVFVDGNDVYVAGSYVPVGGQKRVGVVWKNGDPVIVTDGKESTTFADLFVSGNDVYTVGHENRQGGIVSKYWKNEKAVTLSTEDVTTYAKSIAIDGADVYVLGYVDNLSTEGRSLKLWKNGKADKLISGRSVIRGGKVAVENGSVYACGYEQVGSKYEPRLFKDGVMEPLEDKNSGHTYAVDLKVHQGNTLLLGRVDSESAVESILWFNGVPANIGNIGAGMGFIAFDVVPR